MNLKKDFMWVSHQAIKQEKIYTEGQLKLTHINFVILNSYVKVTYLRFTKKTLIFRWLKKHKISKKLYWLFSNKKTYYKMTFVRKLYTFQNQLKNRRLFYYLLKSLHLLAFRILEPYTSKDIDLGVSQVTSA